MAGEGDIKNENVADNKGVVVGIVDNKGKGLRRIFTFLRLPKLRSKAGILMSITLLLVAGGFTFYLLNKSSDERAAKSITIGDTTITQADIDSYAKQIETYEATNDSADFGGEPKDVALHDLILNAALKAEAKKHGVSVSDEDVRSRLGEYFDNTQLELEVVDAMDMGKISRIRAENEVYKDKLARQVLYEKELLMANIWYGTKYHMNQGDPKKVAALHQEAVDKLNNTFLPAMRDGKTKEEVAALADNYIIGIQAVSGVDNFEVYAERLVSSVVYKDRYVSGETELNDIDIKEDNGAELKNLHATEDKIAELKKPGDMTEVFASKAGSHMIIRLEGVNSGSFNSWDDLYTHYYDTYVANSAVSFDIGSHLYAAAEKTIDYITTPGLAKASAQAGGCTSHNMTFWLRSYDVSVFGLKISGTRVRHQRSSHNCGSAFTGTKVVTTNAAADASILDNCYGPPPNWAIEAHPPGYNFEGVHTAIGWMNGYEGFPNWTSSGAFSINQTKDWYVDFHYRPISQDNATCTITAYPPAVTPNQVFSATVRVNNTGNTTWPGASPYRLGSADPRDNSRWGVNRNDMPSSVSPGSSVNITITGLRAPAAAGTHALARQMVKDGAAWFGSTCSVNITVGNSPDACPSMPGVQASPSECPPDACPSMPGVQASPSDCAPAGCPSLSNPHINVYLPDRSPWNNGSPPSATTGRSQNYTQYIRDNRTDVIGTDDISAGGPRVGSPAYRLPLVRESYQSATIDYSPFIRNCPYDRNQGSVIYKSFWREQQWRSASSVSYYTCNSGDSLSGSTCRWRYSWTHYHSCPTRTNPYRTCPHVHTETGTYRATAWYRYSRVGGQQQRERTDTAAGQVMQPCYERTYDVEPRSGQAQVDDSEDASRVTYNGSLVTDYGVVGTRGIDPMRVGTRVNNFRYVVSYYVDRGTGPDSPVTHRNRSINLHAPNNNRFINNYAQSIPHETIDVRVNGTQQGGGGLALQAGDRVCVRLTTTSIFGGSQTRGQVNVDGNITSGSGREDDPDNMPWSCTEYIVDKPYFRAYNGDVIAGSNFLSGTSCTPTPGAGILAFNKGAVGGPTRYAGAGTQLAVFALGTVNQFVSAATRGGTPVPINGLTIANTSSGYGGNWGGDNIGCAPDYFADAPDTPTAGTTVTSGSITLPAMNLGASQKVAYYVNGSVRISGNINYSNGPFSSIEQIPSFRLIVNGNIYIDPGVTNIDGVLVAQGGRIYTCSNGGFGAPNDFQLNSACRNSLAIRGGMVAKSIGLYRSLGSLRAGSNHEDGNSTNTAERIIYTPEVWLSNPAVLPDYKEPYESSTSAAPIL